MMDNFSHLDKSWISYEMSGIDDVISEILFNCHSWDDETRTTLSFDEKYTHDSKG